MKPIIYYFSSTGNSQHIAKVIQKKLDSELVPMQGNIGISCTSNTIGFVFPTYFWGIPHIVQEFLQKIKILIKQPYIFSVTSCGLTSGGALGMVNDELARKNLGLSYGKAIRSVSNYIVEYDINKNSIKKTLTTAERRAEQIASDVLNNKRNLIRPPFFTERLFYKMYLKRLLQDNNFIIDNTCNRCGMCQNVCPVKNILLQDGMPIFQHHCEHCLACVHWCPQKAIQFGAKTRNRTRYHNPNISMQELNR